MKCGECNFSKEDEDDLYYYTCVECGEFIEHHRILCQKCSESMKKCEKCGFNVIKSLYEMTYEKCEEIADSEDRLIVQLTRDFKQYDIDIEEEYQEMVSDMNLEDKLLTKYIELKYHL